MNIRHKSEGNTGKMKIALRQIIKKALTGDILFGIFTMAFLYWIPAFVGITDRDDPAMNYGAK